MVTVYFCLLPVIAAIVGFTTREGAVSIGVLRPTRVLTTTLTAWASVVLASVLSIGVVATTGRVYGLSQNNKCSFCSIWVYANGAKTERIKISRGALRAPRIVPALGGCLDPRSGSGMTIEFGSGMTRMLIRFPIGVGNDNGGVINGLWDDRRGMYFYRI